MSDLQVVLVFAVLFAGFYLYIEIARRDIRPWRLKTFFLGGGTLGADLTENNTLGMTFAWSGGTWYFAWLAYQYGPAVLLSQIPWCISIVALGVLLPKIITRLHSRTIHGFLAESYGKRTQKLAAVATTTGYFINGGFELYFSAIMFAGCLGRPDLSAWLAIGVALVVGAYCTIGGYRSNATVDKPHNILGVITLASIVYAVTAHSHIGGTFEHAVQIFAVGALVYVAISLLTYFRGIKLSAPMLNTLALIFTVVAFAVVFILLPESASQSRLAQNVVANSPIPLYVLVATVSFQLFFNMVDMQNWQQIAANESVPPESYRSISYSIIRASLYLLWFPALGGVLLGCAMKAASIKPALTDVTLFPSAFGFVLPTGDDVSRGLLIGILLLGFISTSMSTVDSLAMSALQTMWYDLFKTNKIEGLLQSDPNDESVIDQEREVTLNARSFLIPVACLMALLFIGLYALYGSNVLLFQPVMYAMPLSLLAPALLALFWPTFAARKEVGIGAMLGILFAILAVLSMFVVTVLPGQSDDIKNWLPSLMPLVANGLSILCLGLGMLAAALRVRLPRFGTK